MKALMLLGWGLLALLAAEPRWAMDWEEAREEASARHLPILVMLEREGCPYCRKMRQAIDSETELSAFVTDRFVPVALEAGLDEMPSFLVADGTPTFYLVAPDGRRWVGPIVGAAPPGAFLIRLEEEAQKLHRKSARR